MKILITGINGFVGKHLESMLHKQGYEVSGILRHNRKAINANTTLHFVENLCSVDFKALTVGYDCIVHLAALVHQPKQNDISAYMRLNHNVSVNLAKAAIYNKVGKFVLLSTCSVYENSTNKYHAESEQLQPVSSYAISKYQATEDLLGLFSSSRSNLYVLRPNVVYGKGGKGNYRRIYDLIERLSMNPFMLAKNKRSYISANNLCHFILHLIQNSVATGVYNVSDNHDLSTRELCDLIAKAQGKNILPLPIPRQLMKLLFATIGKKDHYDKIYGEFRLNIDKALATGWQPKPIETKDFLI